MTPATSEWAEGWRIVLGCALASGTGIVLLFFTFNLFVLPLARELGTTVGEIGAVQALIATAALGSPVIGRAADLFGFKRIYFACVGIVVVGQVLMALFATTIVHLGIGIAVLGFFGVGTTALVTTRPVSAHFSSSRGRALGLVAVGVSITAMIAPLILHAVLADYGWRGGFIALAALLLAVGVPAVAWIVPSGADSDPAGSAGDSAKDWSFLQSRDFVFMSLAIAVMGVATAGFVGQLSPMVQAEGLSAATGALALTLFAAGQFAGRLGGGWLLDHFDPRAIAVGLTIIPASGFLVLLMNDQMIAAALFAAAMIGLQQGAELDIFAYFTARRFPVAQYGTVYGALHGVSWIGNGIGILGVGQLLDRTGSYDLAQGIGFAALLLGALLIGLVRLPARDSGSGRSAAEIVN